MNTIEWNGERIAAPGIYHGLPLSVYHGPNVTVEPSISKTGLKTIWSDGPSAYWWSSPYNPNRYPAPSSRAFDLGRACHSWLLGDENFAAEFVLSPFPDFRTKEAQSWKAEQVAAGRTVLSLEDMQTLKWMREGLLRNDLVRNGALDGMVERSMIFREPKTGVWLRSRPDVIPTASGDYVDLKSTSSLHPKALADAIGDGLQYRMQAGMTRMGCEVLDLPFKTFTFVFVLTKPPFDAEVLEIKPDELSRGERQVRVAARLFADGMRSGRWPTKREATGGSEWIESTEWDRTRTDQTLDAMERLYAVQEAAE